VKYILVPVLFLFWYSNEG